MITSIKYFIKNIDYELRNGYYNIKVFYNKPNGFVTIPRIKFPFLRGRKFDEVVIRFHKCV